MYTVKRIGKQIQTKTTVGICGEIGKVCGNWRSIYYALSI